MKINILLVSVFLTLIIYAGVHEMHGIVGLTKLDGSLGCICHNLNSDDSVFVWIEGPDSVLVNDSVDYKIFMAGGPAVSGGFNVAVRFGSLDTADIETRKIIGQLTHTSPKFFINDTVSWSFKYSSPDSIVTDTIYSVANSVNGDSIPNVLDKWNFGENFAVHVYDKPVGIVNELKQLEDFVLEQNYPNPFNPITSLQFVIGSSQFVSLKVYDVLGNEIATLVNEEKTAGNYKIDFNADNLPSGIYFYKLELNSMAQTKKMVLLK